MDICLIEDHDEALKVWRSQKIKGLDLVHLDAHMDFRFYEAEPIGDILEDASSVNDLKQRLENHLSFLNYGRDFDKQANIENYIYPAMKEGIVCDFYWVIPGSLKDFRRARKMLKGILENLLLSGCGNNGQWVKERDGELSASCLGRNFVVCCLDSLPVFKYPILLDIDVDFLVMKNISEDDPVKKIGKRQPWIMPSSLVEVLRSKVKAPKVITISYSVNGGWTPMKHKYLGDDLAYQFSPKQFQKHFLKRLEAAQYFSKFLEDRKNSDYCKAARLNPTYCAPDNNYGPLFLKAHKYLSAKKEFLRILKADPANSGCLAGLGRVALKQNEFQKAKKYFLLAQRFAAGKKMFTHTKLQLLLDLGRANVGLRDFKEAQKNVSLYRASNPFDPQAPFLLGNIARQMSEFQKAAGFYKDAIRLGFDTAQGLFLLLKITRRLDKKSDIIFFIREKFRLLKRDLCILKKPLKKGKKDRLNRAVKLLQEKLCKEA